MENSSKIVCRKCKGPHLTIKCGKEIKEELSTKINILDKDNTSLDKDKKLDKDKNLDKDYNKDENKKKYINNNQNFKNDDNNDVERKHFKRNVNKVKMGSLPLDITQEELANLLYDWGHVTNIKVIPYVDTGNSTAYVEFKNEEEVDYLVKALDRTPFGYLMMSVEKLDN
jgi:hypothetical protein